MQARKLTYHANKVIYCLINITVFFSFFAFPDYPNTSYFAFQDAIKTELVISQKDIQLTSIWAINTLSKQRYSSNNIFRAHNFSKQALYNYTQWATIAYKLANKLFLSYKLSLPTFWYTPQLNLPLLSTTAEFSNLTIG